MQSQELVSPKKHEPTSEIGNNVATRRRHRAISGWGRLVSRRRAWVAQHRESGMATAEYAIAMIAAAGFAGLLIVILKSGPVRDMLTSIVETALGTR